MPMAKENYHYKGYKELLSKKRNFIKFLHHFVNYEWVKRVDYSSLQLCDKGFIDSGFDELESDLIYSAMVEGKLVYFYIITELQSTVDYTMPYRVFRYIAEILKREFENASEKDRKRAGFRLPVVIPIVFYNGEEKWTAPCSFKEYLQDGDLFEDVIDFRYTLVDINQLDRAYLMKNRDAICAAIAVDKVDDNDSRQLIDSVVEISVAKSDFDYDEFKDFTVWLKHTLSHRVESEEDVNEIIGLIEEGDEEKMRTGVDRLFDNYADKEGAIRASLKLIESGMTVQEVSERLKLTDEQIKQVEIRAELSMQTA